MKATYSSKVIAFSIFVFTFSLPYYSYSSLLSNTIDAQILGFNGYHGGCYSDGKRMAFGDGNNGKVYIFNYIPTATVSLDSADVKITGFGQTSNYEMPSACIVGDKLLASDSDPVAGYCIRIWNSVPTSDAFNTSCDYKITGFTNPVFNIRTDGAKFCASSYLSGYKIWIWNSVPASNTDTSSAVAYNTSGEYIITGSFGNTGKFYITHNTPSATNTYCVSIFNSVPSAPFIMGANSARISIEAKYQYKMSAVELRNILYVFAHYNGDAKAYAYIWRDIPAANTDTSTISDSVRVGTMFSNTAVTDLHNVYLWYGHDGSGTDVKIYVNNYDTFTVTGSSLAPSSIDIRHLNQSFEKIRIYSYPGKAHLNSVKLNLTGSCVDADISAVKIYDDVNTDGDYDPETDPLLWTGTFSGKTAVAENLNLYVNAGEKNLLITFDISENAVLNNTVGVNVEYLIFEKYFYEVPSAMSSSLSQIVSAVLPVWNNQVRIDYTQRDKYDTSYLVSIDWDDASGGAPPLAYKVYHIIDGSDTEESSESVSYKLISGLDVSKKHKFKVVAIDSFGNRAPESNLVSDDTSPEWPGVFKISDVSALNAQNQWEYKIRVSWNFATDNTSKGILYEVSVKESNSDWRVAGTTWDNSIDLSGLSGVMYVRMRARDSAGNYTQYGGAVKIKISPFLAMAEEQQVGTGGGTVTLTDAEGEKIELEIPEGALNKNYNAGIEKLMESEYTYRLYLYDSANNERKVIFNKPVTIRIFYTDSKLPKLGYSEDYLHVQHHDGVRWINIGGEVNKTDNTVKTSVYSFSKYRLSGEKDTSKKINLSTEFVTPNNDEINDVLIFSPGWNYTGQISVRVFDVNGELTWEYKGTDKTILWSCVTSEGNAVESGVYLYQIKVEDKTQQGTFLIAK